MPHLKEAQSMVVLYWLGQLNVEIGSKWTKITLDPYKHYEPLIKIFKGSTNIFKAEANE